MRKYLMIICLIWYFGRKYVWLLPRIGKWICKVRSLVKPCKTEGDMLWRQGLEIKRLRLAIEARLCKHVSTTLASICSPDGKQCCLSDVIKAPLEIVIGFECLIMLSDQFSLSLVRIARPLLHLKEEVFHSIWLFYWISWHFWYKN